MTSEAEDSASTATYELRCTDCSFETTVKGTTLDALDVADAHQENNGKSTRDHFVNFELAEMG